MRIFDDAVEMRREVERDLFEMGVRYQSKTVQDKHVEDDPDFRTIELFGYSYSLTNFGGVKDMVKDSGKNLRWAETEAADRFESSLISCVNPGFAVTFDFARWEPFMREGLLSYSYAERIRLQLPYVIHELKSRPETRQAVITIYDQHQDLMNFGGKDRVPCSIAYQLVLRNGELSMVYFQRSCDFLEFFPTDVFLAVRLLEHVACQINSNCGRMIHSIGSLHAFAKDLEGRGVF